VESQEAPAAMLVPMGFLAALCVLIGVFPQIVYPLLDPAARALASIF
jgi:formate hydrogenlyase subunit 3/multisubunit Na+/H+ antiporter MnhD subunit